MVLSKKIVYATEMKGFPTEENFRLEEEELDENSLQENQMLIKTICLRCNVTIVSVALHVTA